MFTGIITDLGRITEVTGTVEMSFRIETTTMTDFALGSSICCSGVCLTVVEFDEHWFEVNVSAETLNCTIFKQLIVGDEINLEKSLRVGDELGGNFVTGHVDSTINVLSITPIDFSHVITFSLPAEYSQMIVAKGAVTISGVALTVNTLTDQDFSVCIIPHTFLVTNFKLLRPGSVVNLEVDILARYITKMAKKYNE